MTETVTNELLLEHLKRIQTKLYSHDERFARIGYRLVSVPVTGVSHGP